MLNHVDEGAHVSLKQINTQKEKENKSRRVQHPLSISLWYTVKQQLKFAKLNVSTKMSVLHLVFSLPAWSFELCVAVIFSVWLSSGARASKARKVRKRNETLKYFKQTKKV